MAKLEDDPKTLVGWFKKNYPSEFDLQRDINIRANTIYNQVPSKVEQEGMIYFSIRKNPNAETGAILVMTDWNVIFLGALARAILESLKPELEGLLSSGIVDSLIKKKIADIFAEMSKFTSEQQIPKGTTMTECKNCNSNTLADGKFCANCGVTLR